MLEPEYPPHACFRACPGQACRACFGRIPVCEHIVNNPAAIAIVTCAYFPPTRQPLVSELFNSWDANMEPCSTHTCVPCRLGGGGPPCGMSYATWANMTGNSNAASSNATTCNYMYVSCEAGRVVGIHLSESGGCWGWGVRGGM